MTHTIAVVGCGTMGQAIVSGLLAGGVANGRLQASVRREERRGELESALGIRISLDNAAVARAADIVILAVKPQGVAELFSDGVLREVLRGKLLVSICAGVRLEQLSGWLPDTALIRAMPNTPCLIREGMTVLSPGPNCTARHLEWATQIFASVGRCRTLDEKHLDAVTALSGSGPAFAYVMLEALADGGVMMGLPRAAAFELAAQTMQGAARMVLETGGHPAALRDQVTTPAGCTIAGLLMMDDGRIRSTLARSIQEATRVAAGLGRPQDK